MRYSYGDLFQEHRKYNVMFRIWPGTQRLMMWGDPEFATAYGKAFQFCGATGVEWCEPLSFKGRKGGGLPGGRTGLADASLTPKYDFQKYEYSYKLWGRALYNPATVPQAETAAEKALASASRILPLITSAHGPSAANNNYWPEMYYNMSIVDANVKNPYGDSPSPRVFGNVSPFDPEMFASVAEYAAGKSGAKYTPLEVAEWLDGLADAALKGDALRAWSVDIQIMAGLGRFFAAKFRSAVAYAEFERTRNPESIKEAVARYRAAREAWAKFANVAKGVYRSDVSFGYEYQLRGHWLDRLVQIDEDIARMEKMVASNISVVTVRFSKRVSSKCRHTPPARFKPGAPVDIAIAVDDMQPTLRYRHVNQVESFVSAEMTNSADGFRARIPSEYTNSAYPLQYYFELAATHQLPSDGRRIDYAMYPGLGPKLTNQPYFVIRQG
jgi:hypothetical protein